MPYTSSNLPPLSALPSACHPHARASLLHAGGRGTITWVDEGEISQIAAARGAGTLNGRRGGGQARKREGLVVEVSWQSGVTATYPTGIRLM